MLRTGYWTTKIDYSTGTQFAEPHTSLQAEYYDVYCLNRSADNLRGTRQTRLG